MSEQTWEKDGFTYLENPEEDYEWRDNSTEIQSILEYLGMEGGKFKGEIKSDYKGIEKAYEFKGKIYRLHTEILQKTFIEKILKELFAHLKKNGSRAIYCKKSNNSGLMITVEKENPETKRMDTEEFELETLVKEIGGNAGKLKKGWGNGSLGVALEIDSNAFNKIRGYL